MKSIRPKDEEPLLGNGGRNAGRNPEGCLSRRAAVNETHRSTTGPEARLARKGKGKEARLCFGAHLLMDHREGLVVDVRLTLANGTAERDTALSVLSEVAGKVRITVGADSGYDTRGFVPECRNLKVAPRGAETALGH